MIGLDESILLFLNPFARASWTFDRLVGYINRADPFKGWCGVALFWCCGSAAARRGSSTERT